MQSFFFLLIGPSGVGKSTVMAHLKKQYPELIYPPSLTTRIPRPIEIDQGMYHFVSDEKFEEYKNKGLLLEWAIVHNKGKYGTLKNEIEPYLMQGKSVFREIDTQGAENIKNGELGNFVQRIFILPYSIPELRDRIKARSPLSEEEIDQRMKDAEQEILYASQCEHTVISRHQEIDRMCEDVEKIIEKMMKG